MMQLASKQLRESSSSQTQILAFVNEIKLVATLEHPNIVRLKGVAWTKASDLQALFEYMDSGDLRTYLSDKRTPRQWTTDKLQIALDVAEGLAHVHSLGPPLAHRNPQSKSVLLTTNVRFAASSRNTNTYGPNSKHPHDCNSDDTLRAELTDFGIPRLRSKDNSTGSRRWLAPEVVTGDGKYGPTTDIYSFGVLLSEIDAHALPYDDGSGANDDVHSGAAWQRAASGASKPSLSATCPSKIVELANRCFALKPVDRPTVTQLAIELLKLKREHVRQTSHPW